MGATVLRCSDIDTVSDRCLPGYRLLATMELQWLLWLLLIFTLCLGINCSTRQLNTQTALGCHQRYYQYTYNNTMVSATGEVYRCEGQVRVKMCWGRCDSDEVPEYHMPYKKAKHPVCTYSARQTKRVPLTTCHPDHPNPVVEVVEAKGCACMTCSSTDTTCLSLT